MMKDDVTKGIFEQRVGASPLPTRWLKFYLKVVLPLGIIANLATIGMVVSSVLKGIDLFNVPVYPIILTAVLVLIALVTAAMAAVTLTGMRSLKLWSLKTNYIYLMLGMVIAAGGQALDFNNGYYSFSVLIQGVIGTLIFNICNYIYFEKRRYLFDGTLESIDVQGSEDSEFMPQKYDKNSVALLVIITLGVFLGSAAIDYAVLSLNQEYYTAVKITDTTLSEAEVREKADEMAVNIGYNSFDELAEYVEMDLGIKMSGKDTKEQLNALAEYMGLTLYEEALGAIDPFTSDRIYNYSDYIDYLTQAILESPE